MNAFLEKLATTLRMIKFEHTLFALPFAFLGAIMAAAEIGQPYNLPTLEQIVWITLAMFGARSAAMTFNRIIDRHFDAANPRTAARELPAGKLSVAFAWGFFGFSILVFEVAAWSLNELTFLLSPIALISILGYSYAKRFTSLAHLILGWSLAISPTAAWIAVTGDLKDPKPIMLSIIVMMWTAGFDVLYACQDYEFDKKSGLRSIPARFGIRNSLRIARVFHLQAFAVLVFLYGILGPGWISGAGVGIVGFLLTYQHMLVKPDDLSRMNAAFFTTNAFVSVILLVSFGGEVILR
jgi:4-hydroxybenzoate polyprenyltransferase